MSNETIWLVIGFVGQGMFSARFVVQWLQSERRRRSVIPVAFWYFSLAGGAVLLSYAIYRLDPVFIVGQLAGLFIYARNLHLIGRERRQAAESEGAAPPA
ncbi:MAG: lipid A biosynthesis protein [Rhodospirillaceae bacterium]|nr:lipid A biosynthesis protein [Rhodospirillaceae bacterium]